MVRSCARVLLSTSFVVPLVDHGMVGCCVGVLLFTSFGGNRTLTDGSYTTSTRAHTHSELIREWLGSLRGDRVNPSGEREREKDRA